MPLIQGQEIRNLINLLNERGVKIYHACQYKDFKTYLQIGGIPSRNLMENSRLPYTEFDTDNVDRTNEVWNKVFANLSDFGFPFARGNWSKNKAPTPNPYGPILFILNPEVLTEAIDIAICLRSAGGRDFNRVAESLGTIDEINRIFQYSIEGAPNEYAKAYIKYSQDLKRDFNNLQAMTPEVSCTINNERFSFNSIEKIIVDPYIISGRNLLDKVRNLHREYQLGGVIWQRLYDFNREQMIQELANLLFQRYVAIGDIARNEGNSENLRDWARRIISGGIGWQYERCARYLRSGTILELHNEVEL